MTSDTHSEAHGQISHFMKELLDRAPQMNFFQFCQLLELHAPQLPLLGSVDSPGAESVRFRPFPKVGFPSTEMSAVELDEDRPLATPSVRTTFLGLYGVNAAMPHHFIEDIVLRREGSEAVAAFLDIFNHRIATLFYRSWRKYRYPVGFRPGGKDDMSGYLLSLAGFGIGNAEHKQGVSPARILSMLGLLTQRTRTAEGLVGVIRQLLPGAGVLVKEFHPIWVRLEQPFGLRSSNKQGSMPRGLGDGHVIGRGVMDKTQTVLVTIQPANARQANDILPDARLHRDMRNLIRVYLGYKVDAELRMALSAMIAPQLSLSKAAIVNGEVQPRPRLAWTTLLKPTKDRIVSISLGRYGSIAA
ncbi:type VI secretion system baseplate subunit TssG [Glaciimonas sp. PAMC28666]|uniref:type VI secretion system baseplate subunit TssG n=1 Tax=Glaciimonas sp. PAMC28666 TaxID=2807626 RepID=UPI00196326C8|nr:type VI secretion system baseplate subunit TssG [Glaciimonas sp. PAMC28666]QRX83109.1 type VI secretion system baseplate subunit TssG [Glaciimonas sp. PAMC28666]